MRSLVLLAFMLCGVGLALSATLSPPLQPVREPRFESVGAGVIPRDVVPTFVQDQAGWFWIGTGDGLVRFDGYSFRPQLKDSPDPAARNLGWVQSLLAGRDGRVWIGTETEGLAVYDPAKDNIVMLGGEGAPPAESQSGAKQRPLPTIRALAEDPEGAIYIGSLGGGLEHLDPKTLAFKRYRHSGQEGSLPNDQVRALLVDRSGTLWVGTWAGLGKRLKGSQRFEVVLPNNAALTGHTVTALFEATDGRIWVGTQEGAVVVLDPQSPHESHSPASVVGALKGAVTSLLEAPGHRMWVGRVDGIQILDLLSLQPVQQLQHDARRPTGLAGNEVTTLMADQAGWIWVGGFGLGLQRFDPNNQSIWMRGPDLSDDSPLRSADVRSILQLDDGLILAATHDGPVAVLNPEFRAVSEINLVNAVVPAGLKGSSQHIAATPAPVRVEAMAQTLDRTIWLGAGPLVYQFSPQRRYLRAIAHRSGQTRRLLASRDGSLWVGTQMGVYRLLPGAAALEAVRLPDGETLHHEIHALAEGPDGDIWLGTVAGLYRIAAGGLVAIPVPSAADKSLSGAIVIGLLFDSNQTLWVDTGVGGLHRRVTWDGKTAGFERISEQHRIFGRPFGVNLMEDGRGRIWTHMYVYDPRSDQLHALTAADGADLGTGWFSSYAKTRAGQMLFGGSKGVMVVTPDVFDASRYAPPLRVSELKINGETQSLSRLEPTLALPPHERSFSVVLAALDYADPVKLRYAYQLQGFDPAWIQAPSDSRIASYSNLGPGTYTLKARATNRSGFWSPNERHIQITVLPTWWQTPWAYGAGALLGLGLLYGIVRLRTRGLLVHQALLEHKVLERTSELQSADLQLQLAAKVFTHAREGIVITDAAGLILDVNETFTSITGYSREEVLGHPPSMLKSGLHGADFYDAMWRDLNAQGFWSGEIWNKRKNREMYPQLTTISTVRDHNQTVQQYVGLFSDITKRKQLEEQVRQMAYSDYLTNLPNRRILDDRLAQAMAASQRTGLFGALMFLDLDNFKLLNDTQGHEVGDLLLLEVARRLKACVREMDTIARFGGDEFVVMLTELNADKTQARDKAVKVAEQIRLRLAEPYVLDVGHLNRPQASVQHTCTASMGVAFFGNRQGSRESVVASADAAMYQAKSQGRNRVCLQPLT